MVAAARAGKHIFTEKVLAATLGEAEETFQLRSTKVPGADARWLTIADLPPALPSSFDQWIGHIKDGTTADENLRIALDLTLLMEAANESARTGRTVLLADS
jgi:predicted dehydrogenase